MQEKAAIFYRNGALVFMTLLITLSNSILYKISK